MTRAHEPVLLFDVGGRRFGAAASTVRRVSPAAAETLRRSMLGTSPGGTRALVAATAAGESALAIDGIVGMLPEARVHPLPPVAAACMPHDAIAGLVEYGDELLPLVDLRALFGADLQEVDDGAERGA